MDSAYLLDQLPGAAIGQLMRTAIQEQPQRVEKNTGGRVATFLVRPPLSYKVDSSLPDNQILVDRRTLARLEATSQKCDELERTGQHYQQYHQQRYDQLLRQQLQQQAQHYQNAWTDQAAQYNHQLSIISQQSQQLLREKEALTQRIVQLEADAYTASMALSMHRSTPKSADDDVKLGDRVKELR